MGKIRRISNAFDLSFVDPDRVRYYIDYYTTQSFHDWTIDYKAVLLSE